MEKGPNQYLRQPGRDTTPVSGEAEAGAMDLQGNIENFKLPDIFQLLAAGRKSGTLGIQREDDIVMVYFDRGQIVYGYGPQQIFHIGRLLRERGRISETQLDEAVLKQSRSETNQRLGQILIELGHVDRADVMEVVRSQVEGLLYSLMKWQSGSFKFYEGQYPTQEEITVEISAENVILEGLRRLDEMNHLRDTLPDMNSALAISQAGEGHTINISLCPEEWNLLALIDGRRTIRDIVDISNLSEIESLKKLASLKLAGLLCAVRRNSAPGTLADTVNAPTDETTIADTKRDAKTDQMTGGTDRLEGMMTRLAGLLEDFLQGSGSPSSSISSSMSIAESSQRATSEGAPRVSRLVGNKPLAEIIAESSRQPSGAGADVESQPSAEPESDEEKMWNEFTG